MDMSVHSIDLLAVHGECTGFSVDCPRFLMTDRIFTLSVNDILAGMPNESFVVIIN
jgi:hypothetical protein